MWRLPSELSIGPTSVSSMPKPDLAASARLGLGYSLLAFSREYGNVIPK